MHRICSVPTSWRIIYMRLPHLINSSVLYSGDEDDVWAIHTWGNKNYGLRVTLYKQFCLLGIS